MKCPKCFTDSPSDSVFCGRCGTSLPAGAPPPTLPPGATLLLPVEVLASGTMFAGRYQVIEEIGQGGMGRVYKVLDREVGEKIALKLLKGEIAAREDTIRRFRDELRLARSIVHKNVCRMFDLGCSEGMPFITMEYVEGEDLKKFIRRSGQLTAGKALTIARQVGEGLAEAHRLGIVHRDMKPQNIMIDGEGNARIMDFGIARSTQAESDAGVMIGTPEYMSPEQVEGKAADARADIYALGVIMYEMLAGRLPFESDTPLGVAAKHKREPPPDPRTYNQKIPPRLAEVILKCLEKDPERRYASTAELLAALDQADEERARPRGSRETRSSATVKAPAGPRPSAGLRRKKAVVPVILLAAVALAFTAYRYAHRKARIDWAEGTALPEVMRLIGAGRLSEAFWLAREAEDVIPGDPRLNTLWPEMSRDVSIETDPAGARVFVKAYNDVEGDWHELGTAPITATRIPQEFLRWKVEKPGLRTIEAARPGSGGAVRFALDRPEDLPERMVRVPGGKYAPRVPLLVALPPIEMGAFLIDKFEVTNREFKEFADKGGYTDKKYWKHPFAGEGRTLSWEAAMELFKDRTGRPGPSTWELGGYAKGQDDYPVGGISWYEAAAYAEFSGKSLPTLHHWIESGGLGNASSIIPLSNFQGQGPVPGGRFNSLGPFGTYDMAGNVREWCLNASGDMRYILGGDWDDPSYLFFIPFAVSPFDRSAGNGLRCVKHISPESFPALTAEPVPLPFARDFGKETPVSDEDFAFYKRLYAYDRRESNAVIESVDDSSPSWRREKVTYDAAYGNERIIAYLYLPKETAPPYQTVVFFPGSNAVNLRSSADLGTGLFDFLVKSGRAVLFPVYKSTYERGDGFSFEPGRLSPNNFRDHSILWYKDFARSIDFLESRPDVDTDRLAYLGYSWGAHQGVLILGLEKRIKAGIFLVGGFVPLEALKSVPEADHINFAPRVTIPSLMLNGRFDYVMPLEMSPKPMFRFLGAPVEHKKQIIYDTDHSIPRNEMIKETLNWLDQYLGPVKKAHT